MLFDYHYIIQIGILLTYYLIELNNYPCVSQYNNSVTKDDELQSILYAQLLQRRLNKNVFFVILIKIIYLS